MSLAGLYGPKKPPHFYLLPSSKKLFYPYWFTPIFHKKIFPFMKEKLLSFLNGFGVNFTFKIGGVELLINRAQIIPDGSERRYFFLGHNFLLVVERAA